MDGRSFGPLQDRGLRDSHLTHTARLPASSLFSMRLDSAAATFTASSFRPHGPLPHRFGHDGLKIIELPLAPPRLLGVGRRRHNPRIPEKVVSETSVVSEGCGLPSRGEHNLAINNDMETAIVRH